MENRKPCTHNVTNCDCSAEWERAFPKPVEPPDKVLKAPEYEYQYSRREAKRQANENRQKYDRFGVLQ